MKACGFLVSILLYVCAILLVLHNDDLLISHDSSWLTAVGLYFLLASVMAALWLGLVGVLYAACFTISENRGERKLLKTPSSSSHGRKHYYGSVSSSAASDDYYPRAIVCCHPVAATSTTPC